MNKIKFLTVLIVTSLLGTGCSDEFEGKYNNPIVEGDEIIFGAENLSTFDNGYSDVPQSRTYYGNADWDGKRWHYPLSWVYGDSISVYCEEASGAKYTHYTIEWNNGQAGDVATEKDVAYMMKVGENGLHWGDLNTPHHFYAFYPTSLIKNDDKFVGGVVHGTIPSAQEMVKWEITTDKETGQTVYKGVPNMEYALMRADTTITPKDVKNDKISLNFKPLVTAVDITIEAGDITTPIIISQVQVAAINKAGDENSKQAVCGDFEYDIDNNKVTLVNKDVVNDYSITISLWNGDKPIELVKPGDKITFTVFLLPGTDSIGNRTLHNLQVRVPGWNSAVSVKTYNNVNIPVGTKSQVYLPKYAPEPGANTWLGSLPDEVYISQLSIPGSVNAFSGEILNDEDNYPGEGKVEMDQTQTVTVTQQLDYGVRALEIATERSTPLWGANDDNLGTDGSLIAGETKSSNLNAALITIAKWIKKNPTEFVIVMPYYAPNASENSEAWSHQLRNYLQSLNGKISDSDVEVDIIAFDNSMTIGDARGKILFLSRMPGQRDQWIGKPQYTTAIYGWNSDKNRWRTRGYNIDSWDGKSDPKTNGYTKPTNITTWKYDAQSPKVSNLNYYIQDWFRVCNEKDDYRHAYDPEISLSISPTTKWYESFIEKKDNVEDFMSQTIGLLRLDKTGSNVCINSLAGYYVVSSNNGVSAIPHSTTLHPNYGKHGDIPPFARDINDVVYKYILSLNYENRGPLGIFLINYVGIDKAFGGMEMHGDYIVRALIDNNFRFPLLGSKSLGN